MDATKLVVGQKVWMQSGDQLKEATVTGSTEEYIEVKPVAFDQGERPWMIHFQKDGKQFAFGLGSNRCKDIGNLGVYDWCCGAWGRFDPRPLCGDGRNPWELTDTAPSKGIDQGGGNYDTNNR
jgi:hypothetical protein